ncbi:hypothetical protein F5Y13DRAFT_154148 [Hypoxylon sp. FL1857]|nr:hypothetical protein F5Y13DRAFT_154148 [Hypoxylon sp. FL1857]
MQLSSGRLATLAVSLCLANIAASYDSTPFLGPLDPWKVNSMRITAPAAGQPGTADIELAIENPNTVSAGPAPHAAGGGYLPFSPSAANCSAVQDSANPGVVNNTCVETSQSSYGVWSVEVAASRIDPTNLDLTFTLNYNISRWGEQLSKVYDGTAHFAVGTNLAEGVCDEASGLCTYKLSANATPVLVPPTMTECQGTCSLPSGS